MTKVLSEYFRINNLGDFQKAEFAKEIQKNIKSSADLTDEIKIIADEIRKIWRFEDYLFISNILFMQAIAFFATEASSVISCSSLSRE